MNGSLIYLALLGATLMIEVPLAAGLAGHGKRREVSTAAMVLNLITHPTATAVICLAGAPWMAIELAIAALEALGLCTLTSLCLRRSILVALAANALSAAVGAAFAASS